MQEPLTPRVIQVMEDVNLTNLGQLERRVRVQYMVGVHGPFTVTLTEAEFTAGKVKELMEARARALRELPTA